MSALSPTRREALGALLAAPVAGLAASPMQWTLQQASEQIRMKMISPVELTRACLDRIALLNPRLNAFITVMSEQALDQARALEAELHAGSWRGPLHGIPIGLKDLFDTAGVKTTCASAVFADRIPTEDAEVVMRLKRAGAVLLGKQNMHEFAYGATSVASHFGPVHNPWNPGRIAGGSSGGSAAGCRRVVFWRSGFRYRWLDSPAGSLLVSRGLSQLTAASVPEEWSRCPGP